MFWKKILAAVLLAGMLVSGSAPFFVSAVDCDALEFISDLTIPDGSAFAPGAAFTKTWRFRNTGSCTWGTGYEVMFYSGEPMGAPASVNLPVEVVPNQQVDVSINMVAPNVPGHYRGYWMFRSPSGDLFGIGASGSDPFWVDINVVQTSAVVFDFVSSAPYAGWKSGVGTLPYPGASGDRRGYAYQLDHPHLEDDSIDSLPGLLFVPHNRFNGYIQATYPEFLVQQGDHLQTLVNCEYGATRCYVTFQINYQMPNGYIGTLWSWREAYDGRYYRADIDLSRFAGQQVKFILMTLATGYATYDRPIWGSPRIVRTGSVEPPAPPATLTPLPPMTPTTTPFVPPPPTASQPGCDRATFITDVNVSDGSLFAPGAVFSKTWRIKNSGLCTWTTDYGLVFYEGEQMGAPTRINMPQMVYPGQAVDLTVNMTAPSQPGAYRGFWILQNPSGALFGIGKDADSAFWVEINVSGDSPVNTGGYDFVANACAAEWKSYAGWLPCPGSDGDRNGFVIGRSFTQLEDGTMGPAPSLLVAPEYRYNGYIQGFYPRFTVQPGDRFRATVGCEYGSKCYVTFMLQYMTDTGWIGVLWSGREGNEGLNNTVDIDLTPLAGRSVRFILTLLATGYPTNDRAVWTAPYIVRAEAPVVSTPTPTTTPTTTPSFTPPPISEWLTYTNQKYGFQIKYPNDGQLVIDLEGAARINLPFTPGTNLKEKYLDIVVRENIDPCLSPLASGASHETSEPVTINGIPFLKQTGGDGAAGNFYQWFAYSTVRGNACVSLDFVLHSINPGNYTTPPPVYDQEVEKAVFEHMVSTFVWLPGTPTATPTFTPTLTPTGTPTPQFNDWLTYTNQKYGFLVKYPLEGQLVLDTENEARINLPIVPGTNLGEKYLEVKIVENANPCQSPLALGGPLETSENIFINGIPFLKQTGMEPAAGNLYQWTAYSTLRYNACISLGFVLHSTNPGNYLTPPPVFDEEAEKAVFGQMMTTFAWLTVSNTETPTPTPQVGLLGPYAVVRVGMNGVLNIRENPGASSPIVGTFPADSVNIMRTGPTQQADGSTWVQVQRPDEGVGWVNFYYLTEYLAHEAFCGDMRIVEFIDQLKQAVFLSDGQWFSSLVSPKHGVDIRLWAYADAVNFSTETAKTIFSSSTSYNWGGGPSGIPDVGTFADIVQPKMIDVFYSPTKELYCDNLTNVYPLSHPWPYPNIRYYNLYKLPTEQYGLDYRTWLIGIEYINAEPYLYGLVTVIWEP